MECQGQHLKGVRTTKQHQRHNAHRPGWPRSLSFLSQRSAASFSILPRMAPSCGRENTVTRTCMHQSQWERACLHLKPVQDIAPENGIVAGHELIQQRSAANEEDKNYAFLNS